MQICLTKKVAEKMKLAKLPPLADSDKFLTWRANITKDGRENLLVFMNDASRYVLVVHRPLAKDFKRLPELFIETLREAMLLEQINPAVIDRYIAEIGEVTFAANAGRQETARLNKACANSWYGLNKYRDNACLSVFASHMNVGDYELDTRDKPSHMFKDMLKRYGLPVIKSRALNLFIRLELDGNDAVRKLRVPANITFEQLHKLMQKAFEWRNYHLYSFGMFKEWSENYYAQPDVELVMESNQYDAYEANLNAKSMAGVKLSDYVPEYTKILYTYDYGDDWHHYIEVESIVEDCEDELPVMISGEGDSPPEDVGGPGGFADFLEITADPEHEDYEHMKEWSKSQWWKPFDFEAVARSVKTALWW
jgi:hypothetical protein